MSNKKTKTESKNTDAGISAGGLLGVRSIKIQLADLKGIEKVVIPSDAIPVTLNFDHNRTIGVAEIKLDDDGNYVANIISDKPLREIDMFKAAISGTVNSREGNSITSFSLASVGIVPKNGLDD